jgi:hypothetical protein
VTSDSIAAWVAGMVGARRLVLVKPPGTPTSEEVDRYFDKALPPQVAPAVVAAERIEALLEAMRA